MLTEKTLSSKPAGHTEIDNSLRRLGMDYVDLYQILGDKIHQARPPMHEALCRPSGTTLDILHVERRAADHSANIGSSGARALVRGHFLSMLERAAIGSDDESLNG
jgi:aryl-alcohol dehydrogenase-like predicted oxidoreductase